MSLKRYLWKKMTGVLQRKGNTAFVNWVQRTSYAIYRATHNANYHFSQNGESRVLNFITRYYPDAVIFDVGANIGVWSELAVTHLHNGRIYSFEPIPQTYDKLLRRVQHYPAIQCHNIGLSNQTGPKEILYSATNPEKTSVEHNSVLSLHRKITDYVNLTQQFIQGDQFCHHEGINEIHFIKINAEGHDLQVLQGFGTDLSPDLVPARSREYSSYATLAA